MTSGTTTALGAPQAGRAVKEDPGPQEGEGLGAPLPSAPQPGSATPAPERLGPEQRPRARGGDSGPARPRPTPDLSAHWLRPLRPRPLAAAAANRRRPCCVVPAAGSGARRWPGSRCTDRVGAAGRVSVQGTHGHPDRGDPGPGPRCGPHEPVDEQARAAHLQQGPRRQGHRRARLGREVRAGEGDGSGVRGAGPGRLQAQALRVLPRPRGRRRAPDGQSAVPGHRGPCDREGLSRRCFRPRELGEVRLRAHPGGQALPAVPQELPALTPAPGAFPRPLSIKSPSRPHGVSVWVASGHVVTRQIPLTAQAGHAGPQLGLVKGRPGPEVGMQGSLDSPGCWHSALQPRSSSQTRRQGHHSYCTVRSGCPVDGPHRRLMIPAQPRSLPVFPSLICIVSWFHDVI